MKPRIDNNWSEWKDKFSTWGLVVNCSTILYNGTCSNDSVACYLFADEEHRICFLNFDIFQLFCWDLLIFYFDTVNV